MAPSVLTGCNRVRVGGDSLGVGGGLVVGKQVVELVMGELRQAPITIHYPREALCPGSPGKGNRFYYFLLFHLC